MNTAEIKHRITQKLNNLDIDQLTLIENFLNQLTTYLSKDIKKSKKKTNKSTP